jgi:hypothetical protein
MVKRNEWGLQISPKSSKGESVKPILYITIILLFFVALTTVFIKATNSFIKSSDPLAQQILVVDMAKSPEVVAIKGELMRDLIHYYYTNHKSYDSIVRKNEISKH